MIILHTGFLEREKSVHIFGFLGFLTLNSLCVQNSVRRDSFRVMCSLSVVNGEAEVESFFSQARATQNEEKLKSVTFATDVKLGTRCSCTF